MRMTATGKEMSATRLQIAVGHALLGCFGLLLLIVPSAAQAASDEAAETVLQANMRYKDGQYEHAAELYKTALAKGLDNGHVLYNAANASYRLKRYGEAISFYRRALAERPADPDIEANLGLARKQAIDRIEDNTSDFFLLNPNRLLLLNSVFTRYQLGVVALIAYALLWLCVAIEPLKIPGSHILTVIFFVLTVIVGVSAFGTRPGRTGEAVFALSPSSRQIRPAVITSSEAKAYSGNSETYQVVFVLHDGAEVEVAERRGGWIQVLLPEGRRGWVRLHELEVL